MTARGRPVVLAATSGTGKTTIARRLVEASDRYVFSTSATTRPPRPGEQDGVDYHFLSPGEFRRRVDEGAFLEWARVHGRMYGTLRSEVEEASRTGRNVVLDIDVQGARQIKEAMPESLLIFVLPPSVDIMMARLEGRGTEDGATIARRLGSALSELRAVSEFDHVVVNDDLDDCLAEIRAIVEEGVAPELPEFDAAHFRAEIARILRIEYGQYMQHNE
ncbi:MAG: guanylate kinase [Gemmatimonadota bacterium]|nr:guanylate kinase [Gemmatimonadota bacterium]